VSSCPSQFCLLYTTPGAIFTNSSRTLLAKCSQTYSFLGWGWGRGEAHIPPAAPTPLTVPCRTCYSTFVQFTNFVSELLVNIATGEGVEGKRGSSTHTPNPLPRTRAPFQWLCACLLGYLQQDGAEFRQEVANYVLRQLLTDLPIMIPPHIIPTSIISTLIIPIYIIPFFIIHNSVTPRNFLSAYSLIIPRSIYCTLC
jgi:hypothetical protein